MVVLEIDSIITFGAQPEDRHQNSDREPSKKEVNRSETDVNSNYCIQQDYYNMKPTNDDLNIVTTQIQDYRLYLKDLRQEGANSRSDVEQPQTGIKPDWFDEELFENAKIVYQNNLMAVNFAHLSGLLLLVRVDSIYRTLEATGESSNVSKLFKRYFHTLRHVKGWYEGDIFDSKSDAYKSLLIVRGMHNKTSAKFNSDTPNRDEFGFHISKYDLMVTQFAFIGFIVTHPTKVGILDKFTKKDLISMLHFWRVIGYYLGVDGKFNLCSYELEDVVNLCKTMMEIEFKSSIIKNSLNDPPGIMSINITRSVKFIPMLTFYGLMKHLYETLDIATDEIQHKRTRYSNLSYVLIKLVMCRLLAYRPFRAFNNGLIRLSIYLVGKVESWFANHLESTYGHELRS